MGLGFAAEASSRAKYTVAVTPGRKILLYSIIRLSLFVVPFALLMVLRIDWWISAIAAAVISACASYLFLTRQRSAVSEVVDGWRKGDHMDSDNDIENESLDRIDQDTSH